MHRTDIKIVAIDDNSDNLITLKALIREAMPKCQVLTATSGVKGIELIKAEDPDLIILDIVMPDMDGFEVCERLKIDPYLCDIPIIFLTALKGDKASRIKALECGGDGFLAKPIDEYELYAQIRAMVKVKAAAISKRSEAEDLKRQVDEKVKELNQINHATLNLLEDLKEEIEMRKQAEQTLRESEQRFADMAINSSGVVYQFFARKDGTTGFYYISPKAQELFGFSTDMFSPDWDLGYHVHPDDKGEFLAKIQEAITQVSPFNYECRVHTHVGLKWIQFLSRPIEKNDEIVFNGIMIDVTERKETEALLNQSKEEFKALFDKAPIGYHELDNKGCIVRINEAEVKMLGYTYDELIGQEIWRFIANKEESQAALSAKLSGEMDPLEMYERDFVQKDGTILNALLRDRILKNEKGEIIGIQTTVQNITKRKQTENALKISEERLNTLINASPDFICFKDEIGRWQIVNETAIELFQLKDINPIGKTDLELSELTQPFFKQAHIDCIGSDDNAWSNGTAYNIEEIVPQPNEESKIFDVIKIPLFSTDGGRKALVVLGRDITKRKEAELALRQSEEKFRLIAENTSDGIISFNEKGTLTYASLAYSRITGFSVEESLNQTSEDIHDKIHPADRDPLYKQLYDAINDKEDTLIYTYRAKCKNGEYIWREDHAKFNYDENSNYLGAYVICRDITARKQIEDSLHESEQKFREMTNMLPQIVFETDERGRLTYVNKQAYKIFGFSETENILGVNTLDFYIPEDRHRAIENINRRIKGEIEGNNEYRIKRKDGSIFNALVYSSPITVNEKTKGLRGIIIDITEQKNIENALRESEQKFSNILENAPYHIWAFDGEKYSYINKAYFDYTGLPTSETLAFYDWINQIHPDDLGPSAEVWAKAFDTKQEYDNFIKLKGANGEYKDFWSHATPIFDDKGVFQHFQGFNIDITEQLQLEKQYSQLFNQMLDGFALHEIIVDENNVPVDYQFLAVNPAYELQTGLKSSDIIGKTVLEVLPKTEPIWIQKFGEVAQTGNPTSFSNYSGEIGKYFEVTVFSPIKGQFATIVSDITLRKEAETIMEDHQAKLEVLVNERTHELMVRETYLSAIIDNHPGMFWMKNRQGEFIFSNSANSRFLRTIYGSDADQIIGKKDDDFCPPYQAKLYKKEDLEIIKTKKEVHSEDKIVIGTKEMWFEKLKFPVIDQNRETIGIAGYSIDITERIKRDAQLRMQSEAFETFALSILITDKNGIIEWANHAYEKLTGYSPSEVIGKKANMLKSGFMNDDFYKKLWSTILVGLVWEGEFINKRKDGTIYHEESTITPVRDRNGLITHFIAIKTNISHRKEMEEALRQSEERWQFAIEGSGDGVYDFDLIRNVFFYSHQWKFLLGYNDDEIGDTFEEWISRIHPDDVERYLENTDTFLKGTDKTFSNEYQFRCKDNSYKWMLIRSIIVERSESGIASRVIGTSSDITDIKRLEESLRKNIEKERELNEIKSRFVATASHEFRTPLASIMLTNESLINYWERMEKVQIVSKLEKIKSNVSFLGNIVNDVLQISKIQEGKLEFNTEKIDIIRLIRMIVDGFRDDHIETKIDLFCEIESLIYDTDERLMRQAFNNLMSNALKYSKSNGQVTIDIKMVANEVQIDVKDTGIGIPEIDQKHLFTPFFRASNSKMIQGNGLGLNIVKESIKMHGGDITFVSIPNEGTTFTVHLPLNK